MKKKNTFAMAIALALLTGNLSIVQAYTTTMVSSNGKDVFEVQFFGQSEYVGLYRDLSEYTLSDEIKAGAIAGFSYWSDLLAPSAKNLTPLQILVQGKINYANAAAGAVAFNISNTLTKSSQLLLNQALQKGLSIKHFAETEDMPAPGQYAYAKVTVGDNLGARRSGAERGWWINKDTVLPDNEQASDYVAAVRHEMGHALGIDVLFYRPAVVQQDAYKNLKWSLINDASDTNSWTLHLVDQNQNPAKAGMQIITSYAFQQLQSENPSLKASDYFIVDNLRTSAPHANIATAGKLYFVGARLSEVLDGATFDGISGLPVNSWEYNKDAQGNIREYFPEFSHLQTMGMMSHYRYSNYTEFMEAELAVMQDMGYVFDRKKYYGYSVYKNNAVFTNVNGYTERNAAGTGYQSNVYSTVPLGVGLHVYGSYNTITQAADILTRGTGAVGMRIDGEANTIGVAPGTVVHADGDQGIGTLISYGRNQTLNQYGTISAQGSGGNGVQFDFGSSSNGALDEYRGSYIRYWRNVSETTGAITEAENYTFANQANVLYPATPELDGPLVSAYNLSGALTGAGHAIYIGRNALVQEINVLPGASIDGAITSEWKHFNTDGSYDGVNGDGSDALKLRYNNTLYGYRAYIPDLVTQLNFNTDIAYSGNIMGSDNMKLNVDRGTLSYSGTADVINVKVASGAVLAGGTYTLHDMTDRLAEGFSDTTTGQFINHGTILPGSSDMTIQGRLVSDGRLGLVTTADGQSARQIVVGGTAKVDGSVLVPVNGNLYLPKVNYSFLTAAGGITGTMTTAFSGLLNAELTASADGRTETAVLRAADNVGGLQEGQLEALRSLEQLSVNTFADSAKRSQVQALLLSSGDTARTALQSVANNMNADSAALTISSTAAMSAIGARASYLHSTGTLSGASRARAEEETTKSSRIIPLEVSPTTSGWLKFSKSWERLGHGTTSGQGYTTSIGFDHKVNADWKVGEFLSYGKNGFQTSTSTLDNSDTRLGIYGIREHGADQTYVYFDAGRQNNTGRRSVTSVEGSYTAASRYQSRTLELGAEYSHDIDYGKTQSWHRKPYVAAQVVRYQQDGFTESGAGAWNQQSAAENVTYSALSAGMGVERRTANDEVELRLGVKHVLTGSDPSTPVSFADAGGQTFTVRGSNLDKNLLVVGVHAGQEQEDGWRLEGDLALERGHSEQNIQASVMLKKTW